jgi:hypothetical protein
MWVCKIYVNIAEKDKLSRPNTKKILPEFGISIAG